MGKMKQLYQDLEEGYEDPLMKAYNDSYISQKTTAKVDLINSPPHYTGDRLYEPIDVIKDWGLDFTLGNAVKYISRAGRKANEIEDLQKAVWYINRRIKDLTNDTPF